MLLLNNWKKNNFHQSQNLAHILNAEYIGFFPNPEGVLHAIKILSTKHSNKFYLYNKIEQQNPSKLSHHKYQWDTICSDNPFRRQVYW